MQCTEISGNFETALNLNNSLIPGLSRMEISVYLSLPIFYEEFFAEV